MMVKPLTLEEDGFVTNLCLNDSQNPGFCSAWQGIGMAGSFQSVVLDHPRLGCADGGMDTRKASNGFAGIFQSSVVLQP